MVTAVSQASALGVRWTGMDRVGYKMLSDLSDAQDDPIGMSDMTRTAVIKVQGMTCSSCVKNITESVLNKPGVERFFLSLEEGRATVSYDPSVTAPDIIIG